MEQPRTITMKENNKNTEELENEAIPDEKNENEDGWRNPGGES